MLDVTFALLDELAGRGGPPAPPAELPTAVAEPAEGGEQ